MILKLFYYSGYLGRYMYIYSIFRNGLFHAIKLLLAFTDVIPCFALLYGCEIENDIEKQQLKSS